MSSYEGRKRERERKRRKRVTQNRKRYRKKTSCFRRPRTIVFERKIESDVRSPFPASSLLFLRCDLAPVCDHNFEPHRARVDKRGARIFLCCVARLAAGRSTGWEKVGSRWAVVALVVAPETRSRNTAALPSSSSLFSAEMRAWSHRFGGIYTRKIVEAM